MTDLIDTLFAAGGQIPLRPCPSCPDDETLAGYADALLSATERRGVQDHALECAYSHSVLTSLAEQAAAARRAERTPGLRVVARLVERGLALLNAAELGLRELAGGQALGATRGDEPQQLYRITGPGHGLDEIELQAQADGTIRCVVSGQPPEGERSSVVLEVDGMLREKRPFSGEKVSFAPLSGGSCRITVLARRPGEPAREVSEALLELVA